MTDLEARVRYLEDRVELQELIITYCTEIDRLQSVEAVVDCFTDDAVFDLSGLDLPIASGRKEIRDFFQTVFDSMAYEAHYSTNFTIEELEGDTARCFAYVIGNGIAHSGIRALVHARHVFHCRRVDGRWKIARFEEPLLLPLPDKLDALYE